MKATRFSTILITALLSSFIAVFTYSKLFNNKTAAFNPYQMHPVSLSQYPDSGGVVNLTYAAERTVPAVVHVRTKSKVETTYTNPLFEFFYGSSTITESKPVVGFGSGVIVTGNGYIVTNYHVIKGAEDILVTLNDNREYDGKIVSSDPSTDLALLKIEAQDLPYIPFGNSDQLRLGEWVLAVGNPYNLTSTVTAGIISAKARNLDLMSGNYKIESYIQTDAALNPGNSGGALVNTKGELVGITTAIYSPTGTYAGNSFAVPSSIVKKVVGDLKEFGKVQRAVLGITPIDMNAEIAKQHNLAITKGVYVSAVNENSAAQLAGIKTGDVLLKLNDLPVENIAELQEQLSKYRPNDKISVAVMRNNKVENFKVELKSIEGDSKVAKASENPTIFGAKFSELTPQDKQQLGIKYGVRISQLENGKFSKAGIEEGFIITRINNREVRSVDDVKKILNNIQGGVYIEGVYPNGMIAYYAFGI